MSTVAFRASLIREIEQAMKRVEANDEFLGGWEVGFHDGKLDAYAHVLLLIKDEDL